MALLEAARWEHRPFLHPLALALLEAIRWVLRLLESSLVGALLEAALLEAARWAWCLF